MRGDFVRGEGGRGWDGNERIRSRVYDHSGFDP